MKSVVAIGLAIMGCTGSGDVPAPRIGSITPDHATSGVSITIEGNYFCQQPEVEEGEEEDPLACANLGTVSVGSTPSTLGMYFEQTITAEVPLVEPGRYSVSISVAGRRSNAIDFVVDPP